MQLSKYNCGVIITLCRYIYINIKNKKQGLLSDSDVRVELILTHLVCMYVISTLLFSVPPSSCPLQYIKPASSYTLHELSILFSPPLYTLTLFPPSYPCTLSLSLSLTSWFSGSINCYFNGVRVSGVLYRFCHYRDCNG